MGNVLRHIALRTQRAVPAGGLRCMAARPFRCVSLFLTHTAYDRPRCSGRILFLRLLPESGGRFPYSGLFRILRGLRREP